MNFTYDPFGSDDEKAVARVRPIIGDTRKERGPRPAPTDRPQDSNYSDEEVLAALAEEDGHKMKAAALIYEYLVAEWAQFAGTHKLGPESREYRASELYAMQAKTLRDTYGHTDKDGVAAGFSTQLQLARVSS